MTNSLLLLLLASICGGTAALMSKHLTNSKQKSLSYSTATLLGATLVSIPFLFFEFRLPTHPTTWLLIAVSVASYAISNAFMFASYKHADISSVSIIQRLSVVFIFIFGALSLAEPITPKNLSGIILITLGGLTIVYQKSQQKSHLKGTVYAILMALFGSVAAVSDKVVLTDFSPMTYVFVNNALVSLFFMPIKGNLKESLQIIRTRPGFIFTRSIIATAGFTLILKALSQGNVSTIMPVYKSLSLAVPVILGIILFKETTSLPQKITGLILSTIGIFLMY